MSKEYQLSHTAEEIDALLTKISEIPDTTATDAGKFLVVGDNGKITLQSFTNGMEEAY